MPPLDLEVGRLSGVLERVVDSLDENRGDLQSMRVDLGELKSQLVSLGKFLETQNKQLTDLQQRVDSLMALRNRFAGAAFAFFMVGAMVFKYSGDLATALANLFHIK